jgi:outer membrane lipoprotein-sorting protein
MMQALKSGICVLLLLLGAAWAQTAPAAGGGSEQELNAVLTRMDQTAEKFKTTEAEFVWDQFQAVVNETETQRGTLYFRRAKSGIEMAAHITQPSEKYVLFNDSKVRVYQPPPLDQETVYDTGKNKGDVESFMVLGFGGRGHDLQKSFTVRYVGMEEAQGVNAAKLELVPKSAKLRNIFSKILLWIDPARGVSVQQDLIDRDGNYRLAKYSHIQINGKIPDNAFKLKTTSNTKLVSPQG